MSQADPVATAQALAQAAQAVALAAVQQVQQPQRAPLDPVSQAAQAALGKSAKLEVARQAVLTQDLAALARADRDKVRRLENQKLFGCAGEPGMPEDDQNIIVCDDYNASQSSGPVASKLPTLALGAAGLLGAALVAALTVFKPGAVTAPAVPGVPPVPAAPLAQAYDAVTEQLQVDGTWKEIKRERLK